MNKTGTPVVEALKEMGRYLILGILSWLLTGGLEILLSFFQAVLSPEIRALLIPVLTIALRGIDKFLHEKGVIADNQGYLGVRGITYI